MANEIKDKFAASTALTFKVDSAGAGAIRGLASSTAGVGVQSDVVDNTTNKYQDLEILVNIKQGTSPTGNKGVQFYIVRCDDDGTPHRDDGAGAGFAALTVLNCELIGTLLNKAAPSTGDVLKGSFKVSRPGPKWAIAVVHDTVAALDDSTNHWVRYIGLNPEVQ